MTSGFKQTTAGVQHLNAVAEEFRCVWLPQHLESMLSPQGEHILIKTGQRPVGRADVEWVLILADVGYDDYADWFIAIPTDSVAEMVETSDTVLLGAELELVASEALASFLGSPVVDVGHAVAGSGGR